MEQRLNTWMLARVGVRRVEELLDGRLGETPPATREQQEAIELLTTAVRDSVRTGRRCSISLSDVDLEALADRLLFALAELDAAELQADTTDAWEKFAQAAGDLAEAQVATHLGGAAAALVVEETTGTSREVVHGLEVASPSEWSRRLTARCAREIEERMIAELNEE